MSSFSLKVDEAACNADKLEEELLKENQKYKGIKLTRTSTDGEEGYPGAVKLAVYYLISQDDKILIIWEGDI